MRTAPILIILMCIMIAACNKPLSDYSHVPFEYTVSGIEDAAVHAGDHYYIKVKINLVSGDAANEPITMTISGIPANAILDKNNIVFRANYEISDMLMLGKAAKGVYPMQAVFTNASNGVKRYDFNIIVY